VLYANGTFIFSIFTSVSDTVVHGRSTQLVTFIRVLSSWKNVYIVLCVCRSACVSSFLRWKLMIAKNVNAKVFRLKKENSANV